MSRQMRDEEYHAVHALNGQSRYEHSVKKMADFKEVWSLRGDAGWVIFADDEGRQHLPVWPHERYASACTTGDWGVYRPESIPRERWLERWLPGMERDGRAVAVFPTPERKAAVVSPTHFPDDLMAKIDLYD